MKKLVKFLTKKSQFTTINGHLYSHTDLIEAVTYYAFIALSTLTIVALIVATILGANVFNEANAAATATTTNLILHLL